MTNKPPRFIWKWCWKCISPLAILVILAMSIQGMTKNPPSYLVWDPEQVMSYLEYHSFVNTRRFFQSVVLRGTGDTKTLHSKSLSGVIEVQGDPPFQNLTAKRYTHARIWIEKERETLLCIS